MVKLRQRCVRQSCRGTWREPGGRRPRALHVGEGSSPVGGAGGSGMLRFKGKQCPMSIGGISLGATIGASKAELIGEVSNMNAPSDIEGTCAARQAGVAVVGGGKVAELKNSNGVQLKVKGAQVGLELALDLSGMEVSLKK